MAAHSGKATANTKAVGRISRAVRLLWGVSPWSVSLLALLLTLQGVLPVAAIAISQRIIDALATGGQSPLFWVAVGFSLGWAVQAAMARVVCS